MTTGNHYNISYTDYLTEIAESDGAESLLDDDDILYPSDDLETTTSGGGIHVEEIGGATQQNINASVPIISNGEDGSNDNNDLPNIQQVLHEVEDTFRNTSRLNEILDSSHDDDDMIVGESIPLLQQNLLQHFQNEHGDDDGYSYNSSSCSLELSESHVAHLEAMLNNDTAMEVQVRNIMRSRQRHYHSNANHHLMIDDYPDTNKGITAAVTSTNHQDELLGSAASVSASSPVHLIDSGILSDDTNDCNSSASSSSSSMSLLVSPNVSPKRLQRQSSEYVNFDIGGTAHSAVNTSGVSSLTSTPFRASPNKNHHPESSAVAHTNGVYNVAVNTTLPSLAACRKVTVVVRVRPTGNKEADTSSLCLFPLSSNEVASGDDESGGDNENEGRFKGDIIAVNPSAFGSSNFPNAQMALNVARTVAKLVSVFLKQPYDCEFFVRMLHLNVCSTHRALCAAGECIIGRLGKTISF